MRKLFILSVLIFTVVNQSFAVDFKSLEPAEKSDKIDVKEPKALLNDKDYKLKGRVEYDEEGTLFLDTDDVEKCEFIIELMIKDTELNKILKPGD